MRKSKEDNEKNSNKDKEHDNTTTKANETSEISAKNGHEVDKITPEADKDNKSTDATKTEKKGLLGNLEDTNNDDKKENGTTSKSKLFSNTGSSNLFANSTLFSSNPSSSLFGGSGSLFGNIGSSGSLFNAASSGSSSLFGNKPLINFSNLNKDSNSFLNKGKSDDEDDDDNGGDDLFQGSNSPNAYNPVEQSVKAEAQSLYTKKYVKQIENLYVYSQSENKFVSKGSGYLSIEFSDKNDTKTGVIVFRYKTINLTPGIPLETK